MPVDLQKLIDLAGEIPFDNTADLKAAVENFCTNDIAVVATSKETIISNGIHSHNSYEFILAYSEIPAAPIDSKVYDRKKNALFVINPLQRHGIEKGLKNFHLCGLHMDTAFVRSAAEDILGSPNIAFSNDSFDLNHDISMLVRLFLEELKYKQLGHEFMTENLSALIVSSLIRQIKHNLPSKAHNVRKTNNENIKIVIDYINENYASGISCTELSGLMKMDKYSFIRNFKSQTGKTPYGYIFDLKIEKAKKMLGAKGYTVTEISMLCGFSSHSHFTSTFKKKTGLSPTEFRMNP
ncbi:MAG: AraC family transcriptional regulator [Clostridiaceae bacterium]|nr:AraC family transcriptional regulator [Clostridiaceae bacterium]